MNISKPDILTSDNSGKYKVSIRLWSGGLSFSGYIPSVGESFFSTDVIFDGSLSYMDSLTGFFYENDYLSWKYKQVNIIVNTSQYTLVPEQVYDEKRKNELIDFIYTSHEDRLLSYYLAEQKAYIIYCMDNGVYEFCARSFLDADFVPSIALQLMLWHTQSCVSLPVQAYCNIGNGQMDLIVFKQEKLQIVNTYKYDTTEDVLYYILNVWRRAGLDQQNDHIHLFGDLELCNLIKQSLQTYLKHIHLKDIPSEAYLHGINIRNVPIDIIALTVCGL